MSEVLHLEYHAHVPSILVRLDEVNENGVTVVGRAERPTHHMTLPELEAEDAQLAEDFRSVLARLEPVVRAHTDSSADAPHKVRAEAAHVAKAKQDLELARAAHKAEHETLSAQIEAMKAEHARLDLEIAQKAADAAALPATVAPQT